MCLRKYVHEHDFPRTHGVRGKADQGQLSKVTLSGQCKKAGTIERLDVITNPQDLLQPELPHGLTVQVRSGPFCCDDHRETPTTEVSGRSYWKRGNSRGNPREGTEELRSSVLAQTKETRSAAVSREQVFWEYILHRIGAPRGTITTTVSSG